MQRLSRTTLNETNRNSTALLMRYDEIRALLLKHLPPSTSSLFAKPELSADQNIVSWYTDLEGQPYLLAQTEQDKKILAQIQPLITRRVNDIQTLNQSLSTKGAISAEQSQLLTQLIEGLNHDTKQIYVINQEPVITAWGIGKVVTPPAPPPPPLMTTPKTRHWCWLLPLLLLLLGSGLFWWWQQQAQPAPTPIPTEEPKVEVKEEIKPTPVVEPVSPELLAETPPVEEAPKVEVVEPMPETEPQVETVVEPHPVKPVCKTQYKAGEAPQMVIVFDDSASMKYTLLESSQAIQNFEYRWNTIGVTEEEYQYMTRLPNRLSVAKKSSTNIIDLIDKNVDIGLIALKRCPSAQSYGFFNPGKRKALKNTIKNMQPHKNDSGTPLYSGLKMAASMVDGVKREAFILLLSDGQDNCETGDVCALAQSLARQKPKLKINVVDIGGARAANCAANATGGRVFTANNQKQLTQMINQAIKPMTKIEICE